VVWSYAGVRPLHDDRARDAAAVTRDYVFDLDVVDHSRGGAPALSVFGGKLTTHRRLAEHALERLLPYLPEAGPQWTADSRFLVFNLADPATTPPATSPSARELSGSCGPCSARSPSRCRRWS